MLQTLVHLMFSDGETIQFAAQSGRRLMDEATRNGIRLASDCKTGTCLTCKCDLKAGSVDYEDIDEIALSDEEQSAGAIVPCQARATSSRIELALSYTRASQFPPKSRRISVTEVARLSASVYEVIGKVQGGQMFPFLSGQYVNITVPGAIAVRSYSMMTAPGDDQVGFLIRTLPSGAMSEYLTERCKVGDVLTIKGPFGKFYRRDDVDSMILVAGGTGLAPILSILRDLEKMGRTSARMFLAFGVTDERDAFYLDRLDALKTRFPNLTTAVAAMHHEAGWSGRSGTAVDLLDANVLPALEAATAYLCGPPPMIRSARLRLEALGVGQAQIYAEEYQPSGT